MYSTSANFITAIKSNVRRFHWSGIINFDTPMELDDDNFLSGKITRSISGNKLDIGTVYASQISIEVVLPNVSRYELYGKTIELFVSIEGASDVIPMGVYTISEAVQSADHISIKGYDNMTKLGEVDFYSALNNSIQNPYAWLERMCVSCGITLGITSAIVQSFPNGTRKTGFADVVTDAKTWRDVLGYLGAYLGSYAYIGRDGALYLGQYGSVSADTIPSNFRYSSGLSDYRTTYDGLYAIHKDSGVQEYVSNTNSGGIILDLGVNPFLQFTNDNNRQEALQEIIDAWDGVYYVPFKATMPLMPHYDVGDVLTFTEKQAGIYDYGVITEITYDLNCDMSVTCSGDNPRLAEAQDRFTKTVEGLSSDYSTGQEIGTKNFWLLHTHTIANNNIGSTKTLVAQIEFEQKTDVQRMGFMFDCDGDLSASAVIKVEMTVDDELVWTEEYTDRRLAGKIPFPHNMGQRITGKGTHIAKVYMTVTDSKLKWSELA